MPGRTAALAVPAAPGHAHPGLHPLSQAPPLSSLSWPHARPCACVAGTLARPPAPEHRAARSCRAAAPGGAHCGPAAQAAQASCSPRHTGGWLRARPAAAVVHAGARALDSRAAEGDARDVEVLGPLLLRGAPRGARQAAAATGLTRPHVHFTISASTWPAHAVHKASGSQSNKDALRAPTCSKTAKSHAGGSPGSLSVGSAPCCLGVGAGPCTAPSKRTRLAPIPDLL